MTGARVLLAGATPSTATPLVSALTAAGHQVSTVTDLAAAADELSRSRYDAHVLELTALPPDDGSLEALLDRQPASMGILLLPADSGADMVDEQLRRGWTDVIAPGSSANHVVERVTQAVGRALRIREMIRGGTLTPLHAISEEFLLTLDLDMLLQCIVETAQREARCDRVSLMLVETDGLHIRAAVGLPVEYIRNWVGQLGVGIAGHTAITGETLILHRGSEHPKFRDHLKNADIASAVCLPLKVRHKVIGVLNVTNFVGRDRFFDSDVKLLSLLAAQAAVAIQNANLYDNLQTSYLNTIVSLANALEARDNYLSGHSSHVADWSFRIAHHMNLSPKEIDDIRNASTLHDIGKIGVRDAVLLKPGSLDESEWRILQQHPEMGSRIIAPVRHLARALPLILHHHERWDGQGYPSGLAGEDIPLGARIIAVADTYDAMTSHRPYRSAFDRERALAEIRRVSGTQLDPRVVAAFLEVIESEHEPAR